MSVSRDAGKELGVRRVPGFRYRFLQINLDWWQFGAPKEGSLAQCEKSP